MNNSDFGIIVSPMERGQITLPKPYREKLGIVPGMPLQILLRAEEIVVRPLAITAKYIKTTVINPQVGKKDYLMSLGKIKGKYWSKNDDKLLAKKERIWQW